MQGNDSDWLGHYKFLQEKGVHDHDSKPEEMIKQKILTAVKQKADKLSSNRSKIICQEVAACPEENLENNDFRAMRQAIYTERRKRQNLKRRRVSFA